MHCRIVLVIVIAIVIVFVCMSRSLILVTTRPIQASDELTISYGPTVYSHPDYEERRSALHEQYGFWCRCTACMWQEGVEKLQTSTSVEIDTLARLLMQLESGLDSLPGDLYNQWIGTCRFTRVGVVSAVCIRLQR